MQKMISYNIYTKNNEAICWIFIDISSISGDFRDYKCQTRETPEILGLGLISEFPTVNRLHALICLSTA